VDVVKLAPPPFSVAMPRVVVPSLNVIVPVGIPPMFTAVTVALRDTGWPKVEGLGEVERVVCVPGTVVVVFTTRVTGLELLVTKLALPPYLATSR
jgi:hypothetical protein